MKKNPCKKSLRCGTDPLRNPPGLVRKIMFFFKYIKRDIYNSYQTKFQFREKFIIVRISGGKYIKL